jgi:hypothetical protein
MQLTLSERDLELMPPELRRQLFLYLGQVPPSHERADGDATALDRSQVIALLRDVSFHPDGRALHPLLEKLAYLADDDAPSQERLATALPGEEAKLASYLAVLDRLVPRAANQPQARLWRYDRNSHRYRAHPTTRQILRDVLATLARSGEGEEPLWEG